MPRTRAHSADTDPPKFHRLFRFYDPEAVAVMAILLGLFQLLLTFLTYTVSLDIKYMFVCPLCVGSVSVIAGSFALASERTPSRDMLKNTLIFGLAGLVATLIGLFLYIYATNTHLDLPPCSPNKSCAEINFQGFYKAVSGQLLLYDIAAVVTLSFLSFSAFKGLRVH